MGRSRGKGKKQTVTSHEDAGSGEEEKIPIQKKRGRPQKPLKGDIDEDEFEGTEEESKGAFKLEAAAENRKKRKRNSQANDNPPSSVKEGNSSSTTSTVGDDLAKSKSNGFRQITSRRKSRPYRAAEVGVPGTVFLGVEASHQLAGISSNV